MFQSKPCFRGKRVLISHGGGRVLGPGEPCSCSLCEAGTRCEETSSKGRRRLSQKNTKCISFYIF